MPRHITWQEIADELVNVSWGENGENTVERIKVSTDQRVMMVLLLDIAKSLRPLRCRNFIGIPGRLAAIEKAIKTIRPKRRFCQKCKYQIGHHDKFHRRGRGWAHRNCARPQSYQ